MKVFLKDIRPEGLVLHDTMNADVIGVREEDHLKFDSALSINTRFELIEDTLLAKTKVRGNISSTCSRCLEEIHRGWDKSFTLDFSINRNTDYVEIDEDVRQEVVLNLPMRVLCKEDCKGICVDCGVNLNEDECRCKDTSHRTQGHK